MKRESTFFYIVRLIASFVIIGLLIMLYWSSVLLEENMKMLQTSLAQVKSEMITLRSNIGQTKSFVPVVDIPKMPLTDSKSSYVNILKPDPFYLKTLPKLLGPDFIPSGILRDQTLGRPENLHPFSNWATASAWESQCNVTLSTNQFGKYDTFSPYLATIIEEHPTDIPGVPEYWIRLRDDVFWQPLKPSYFSEEISLAPHFLQKHKVTAHDIKFYWDAVMNPAVQEGQAVALRNWLQDIEEIRIIDDYTLVVKWKPHDVKMPDGSVVKKIRYMAKQYTGSLSPLARFVYQYFPDGKKIVEDDSDPKTYAKNTLWAQNFSHHWAKNIIPSCGPWVFEGMTDQQISFKRNADFFENDAILVEGSEIEFKDTSESIWNAFKEGKIDSYTLQPNQLSELDVFLKSPEYREQAEKGKGIHRLDFIARRYLYAGWNQAKPYFKSKKVRQALTMAIDRQRIIQQNMNGMGVMMSCPFFINSDACDPNLPVWPFDPQRARRLLEEDGWYDSDGDGIIDKVIDGKTVPFRFTLTYYVKSPLVKAICEYISIALKEVGIVCSLNGVEITDLAAAVDDKSFDAVVMAWVLGSPPEDPRQLWHSSGAKQKGSSNHIGFVNAEADEIIEQLDFEDNPEKRVKLYHRFDAIIRDEAPYTFLFIPKQTFVSRDYLQNVFIPADRQDLIPGADIEQPVSSIFWLKNTGENE